MTVYVRNKLRKKGRGVFTTRRIDKGDYAISNEAVIIPGRQYQHVNKTALSDYYFDWMGTSFLALGHASLLNHSDTPNLDWRFNKQTRIVSFFATRSIAAGEELTFDYGWDWYPWKKQLPSKKKKVKSRS